MKTILISVSLLLLVRGCAGQKSQNPTIPGKTIARGIIELESKTINGVILTKEHYYDSDGTKYWTIEKFDFDDLENRLERYLRAAPLKEWNKDLPNKFRKYGRQYTGRIVDGKKKIFINFFCDSFGGDWKRDTVHVLGGGDCFFNVMYDPQTGEFSNLSINSSR